MHNKRNTFVSALDLCRFLTINMKISTALCLLRLSDSMLDSSVFKTWDLLENRLLLISLSLPWVIQRLIESSGSATFKSQITCCSHCSNSSPLAPAGKEEWKKEVGSCYFSQRARSDGLSRPYLAFKVACLFVGWLWEWQNGDHGQCCHLLIMFLCCLYFCFLCFQRTSMSACQAKTCFKPLFSE